LIKFSFTIYLTKYKNPQKMNLSYWEIKNWFSNLDFTIVGSGIVGLHCAIALRQKHPTSKILILEKGILPQGASTKNAGFACFGSISEIINDLKTHSQQEVIDLVLKRKKGLELLRKNLGDSNINYQQNGGFEIFLEENTAFFETCYRQLGFINHLLKPIFEKDAFVRVSNDFKFEKICSDLILNPFEGQIDTGNMMQSLLKKAISNNIMILNQQELVVFNENNTGVEVGLKDFSFQTKKLFFATNGFASNLTNNEVKPARAQVLITEPIANLHLKGTFHLDEGYYYFRNIDNRILLGGGRNLDFEGETTTKFGETEIIQNHLEELLKNVILPNTKHCIEHRWSGIMGMGDSKTPIVKPISNHVYCGVRLGGMGVAIGSLVGEELAALCDI
jgi:glycine/D-amino acid oxidase-like deaminating enzyme